MSAEYLDLPNQHTEITALRRDLAEFRDGLSPSGPRHAAQDIVGIADDYTLEPPIVANHAAVQPFTEMPNISEVRDQKKRWGGLRLSTFVLSITTVIGAGGYVGVKLYDHYHPVQNHVRTLPDSQILNILEAPIRVPTPNIVLPSRTHTKEVPKITEITPETPTRILVPKLHIDTQIVPTQAQDLGKKDKWGGEEYYIKFPVDAGKQDARYAVVNGKSLFGEPNTVRDAKLEQSSQAAQRTIIYGHASDIGNNLLFQNLQELNLGDKFTLYAGKYEFTYTVYSASNPSKDGLADDSQVYGVPKNGRKEAALIACLPDSASHSVRIGYLSGVKPVTKQ